MKLKTVLLDLDGTLLPMDQEMFIKAYFKGLAMKLGPLGYESRKLLDGIYAGIGAMVKNDGSVRNEEAFWRTFCTHFGERARDDAPHFEAFYRCEFQQVQAACGFDARASKLIGSLKGRGYRLVLATNPLFPQVATYSRIRWAGMQPEDFELVTTYENANFCKPNVKYYEEIAEKLGLDPCECLMVGNDVGEDMVAGRLGMKTFLLTDCLINRTGEDIKAYPHGSFEELESYIQNLEN